MQPGESGVQAPADGRQRDVHHRRVDPGDAGGEHAGRQRPTGRRRPLAELDGEAPLTVAQTEAGARVIETILGKIAWGAAA